MKLREDDIRRITLSAIQELGDRANPDLVKDVVTKAVEKIERTPAAEYSDETLPGKIILTSFGMNHPGIVSGITKELSDSGCNILDISQKILTDYYTMIMVIDISNANGTLKDVQERMNLVAEKLRVKIYLQHEDIFRSMHRI